MTISPQEIIDSTLALLGDTTVSPEERLAQVQAHLLEVRAQLPNVPQAYLDDLDGDPGVLAALANAGDEDAEYFKVDPLSGETDDTPRKLNVGSDA